MRKKAVPGFSVSLNGRNLVTISTDRMNVVSVRLHGDCVGPEFAALEVSGGFYGGGENGSHLIWLNEQQVVEGDEVVVLFHEEAETSDRGKTIEELYPNEDGEFHASESLEETFRELALMPRVRERFQFRIETPTGETIRAKTEPGDHGFGFTVLWNWLHPEIAKVFLTSSSLEAVKKREGGSEHARFRLRYGQRTKITVSA